MSFFKEEKSLPELPSTLDASLVQELTELSKLIKEKFSPRAFTFKINEQDPNKIEFSFLNARYGMDTEEIDDTNKPAINYFQTLDGVEVHKEKAVHSYWSYSVVSFARERIPALVKGIELLAEASAPAPEAVCRC